MWRYWLLEWTDGIRNRFRCLFGHDYGDWEYLAATKNREAYYGRLCKRCPTAEVKRVVQREQQGEQREEK